MQTDFFDSLPHAALRLRGGAVTALNPAARAQLPQLRLGDPVPGELERSLAEGCSAGRFRAGDKIFFFTRVSSEQGDVLLFQPDREDGLTPAQLEGFSRRMRESMGLFFNQLQQLSAQTPDAREQAGGLNHSFHQMLRLMNDLEFLRIPEEQAKDLFHPEAVDLAQLCVDLRRQSAPMLRKIGVELDYTGEQAGTLISGDRALLQRLLLALIANAARACGRGRVSLELRTEYDRVLILVGDDGASGARLSDLCPAEEGALPRSGQGAGLDVARRIAALHGGVLLARQNGDGLTMALSLPIGVLSARLPLNTPGVERDAGISPILLELAELLPSALFEPEEE